MNQDPIVLWREPDGRWGPEPTIFSIDRETDMRDRKAEVYVAIPIAQFKALELSLAEMDAEAEVQRERAEKAELSLKSCVKWPYGSIPGYVDPWPL